MNTLHAGDSRSAWILVVGCLAIGLVLGFFLGRFGASGPDTAPDQTGSGVVWGGEEHMRVLDLEEKLRKQTAAGVDVMGEDE